MVDGIDVDGRFARRKLNEDQMNLPSRQSTYTFPPNRKVLLYKNAQMHVELPKSRVVEHNNNKIALRVARAEPFFRQAYSQKNPSSLTSLGLSL